MHQMVKLGVLSTVFLAACSAAPVDAERVGQSSDAIRDRDFEVICPEWAPCTGAEEDDDDEGSGTGMGGIGGSGEGSGSAGGGHGGGGGAGAGSGGGSPGWGGGVADFPQCSAACQNGQPAIAQFCRSIPAPQVAAACWAVELAGTTVCMGFCYAYYS